MNRLRSIFFLFFALSLLVWHQQSPAGPAPAPMLENLGDLKRQLTSYRRSGAYDRDVQAAVSAARRYLERRARIIRKPALVLDIDETSLSNWPEIQATTTARLSMVLAIYPRVRAVGRHGFRGEMTRRSPRHWRFSTPLRLSVFLFSF